MVSMMTSLPQVVTMGTDLSSAGMTCSSSSLPAVQTVTTAEGLSVILVPTTMVPENTAVTIPAATIQAQSTMIENNNNSPMPVLSNTSLTPATTAMSLKPLSLQMTSSMNNTPTRTPPLKPPKKFRTEQEEQTRCKRRLDFASLGLHSLQRPTGSGGNRRNERERNRVKLINNTFVRLQEHLPQTGGAAPGAKRRKRKLSKVDTLRGAIEYIRALQDLLDDHDAVSAAFSSTCPLNGDNMMQYEAQSTPSDGFSSCGLASPSSLSSGLASPGSSSLCSGGSIGQETEECPLSPDEQDLLDFASWFE